MDRGAWQVTVHVVAKSRTQLKQLTYTLAAEFDSIDHDRSKHFLN